MPASDGQPDEAIRDEARGGRRGHDVAGLEVVLELGQLRDRRSGDEEVLSALPPPTCAATTLAGADADLEREPHVVLDLELAKR